MKIFINNCHGTLWFCLNILRWVGFLVPDELSGIKKMIYPFYAFFWFLYVVGIYIIVQLGDLFQIWGDLEMMVGTSFLLFTNLAFALKIVNVMWRRDAILTIINESHTDISAESRTEGKLIVKSCNRETTLFMCIYLFFTSLTIVGLAASTEKRALLMRAWYPYDTSKSPAFEMTHTHQCTALVIAAALNISLDTLTTTLIALCRCRLRLLALNLKNLCDIPRTNELPFTPEQEAQVSSRLRTSVARHHAVLRTARQIQDSFNEPILAQFAVSVIIICVSAYQLAAEAHKTPKNIIRLISMIAHLMIMTLQVFLYCYQAERLTLESSGIASAAYQSLWYLCSPRLRRALLVVMIRSERVTRLTAGGIITLSLPCFTAIIKASYTFFTVLKQVEDRTK